MSAPERALRGLAALAMALALGVALTLVAAPLASRAVSALAGEAPPYAEVVLRALQAMCLLSVALLVCCSRGGRAAWGVAFAPNAARRFLAGLAFGVLSMAIVAAGLFVTEVRVVRYDLVVGLGYWIEIAARALIASLAIACLEEVFFRGGLFGLLHSAGGAASALALSALVYAVSHFLIRGDVAGIESGIGDTLHVLAGSVSSILQAQNVDSMLALGMAGVWLAALRQRDGDIAACVGTHMGWVLVIKVFKKYTYINPDAGLRWLAGAYDDVIGWLAALVLGGFALGTALASRARSRGARP